MRRRGAGRAREDFAAGRAQSAAGDARAHDERSDGRASWRFATAPRGGRRRAGRGCAWRASCAASRRAIGCACSPSSAGSRRRSIRGSTTGRRPSGATGGCASCTATIRSAWRSQQPAVARLARAAGCTPCGRGAQQQLAASVGPRDAPLVLATLLGDQERLTDATKDAFLKTGSIHLLVISGAHVAMLAAIVWALARAAGLPSRVAAGGDARGGAALRGGRRAASRR